MKRLKKRTFSKSKLVFFGNERLATGVSTDAPTLRALVKAGYQICAVVSTNAEAVSRNKRNLEIVDVAHAYHIPVLLPNKVMDIKNDLVKFGADAAVLVAYGKIIPQEIINIFPRGIINIHPSLLPKLRGSTPVETAILYGLESTGVSLMKITAEMDAGPVFAQKEVDLNRTETKPELAINLLNLGGEMLLDNLDKILEGSLRPKPQDESEATYTKLLSKSDGFIDFNQPAEAIESQVRAFLDFPKSRANIFNRDIVITKSRVVNLDAENKLIIKCQPGYLEILELIAPSGKSMTGTDFIRGYQKN